MNHGGAPSSHELPARFAEQRFAIARGLIDPALAAFFWSYSLTKFKSMQMAIDGKGLVPMSPWAYGDAALDGLLEFVRPDVQRACGLALLPTYGFIRVYKPGDVLPPHRDRPACEISVSLAIGGDPDTHWPLHVEGPRGPFAAVLEPGDGLLYRGIECPHWREAYTGKRLVQIFLHYVDANGPHKAQKYDGRRSLMAAKAQDKGSDGQAQAGQPS